MKMFELLREDDPVRAIAAGAKAATAQQGADIRFIAGGTTLIDLMKLNVETPQKVVDVTHLPFGKIETLPDGGLKIGAMVRNSELAHHPIVRRDYAVLSEAILSGASTQLRNMATTAGNHPDTEINPLGARGIGEIGLAGIAAAITAATYHATGVRVRELPSTIDKLI